PEVGAVDRQRVQLAVLVLDEKPAEGKIARGVVASAVDHDEGRVGRLGRIELNGLTVVEVAGRLAQRDLDRGLLLALRRRRPPGSPNLSPRISGRTSSVKPANPPPPAPRRGFGGPRCGLFRCLRRGAG